MGEVCLGGGVIEDVFYKGRSLDTRIQEGINNDKKTTITSTGRTDKGVHALSQYGHCDINVNINEKPASVNPFSCTT